MRRRAFSMKSPKLFWCIKRFWHCLFRIFEFSWSSKNFCYRFNFKTSHQVILSEKYNRKLKWICSPQLHSFITFEARKCHLNTRNKEELVCKCFSDLRLPNTSYRVCLIEYVWIPFPGCIIFVRFSALLRTSRLFTAGGGEGGSASLPELKGGGGRGEAGIIGILQSLKGWSGKF